MKRESLLFIVAGVAVSALTLGYIFLSDPEAAQISSSDGKVRVTGLLRQTQTIEIEGGPGAQAPLLGATYDLLPEDLVLDLPLTVTFKLDAKVSNQDEVKVFKYNSDLLMWEMIDQELARTEDLIAIETTSLGRFALGREDDFSAPVFATTYDEIKDLAPENTVGYEIIVGYTQDEHATIRLKPQGEFGGCNGLSQPGDDQQRSRLEREVRVGDGEESRLLTFVFLASWFTSSSGGCAEGESLSPKSEYDTMSAT